jgi:hypothetical protein
MVVDPIPKISAPTSDEHYRPICRINLLAKIISVIVNTQLSHYIEEQQILNEHQSGFRNKHSCTTAVLDLSDSIINATTNSKCVFIILLDFSNAFPSVNHQRLIEVLKSIGLDAIALKWYISFLNGWSQSVAWNGIGSDSKSIKVGVFQGEGNSQTLFSLFINHISSYIQNCTLRQFADDTCLTIECDMKAPEIESTIKLINDDLNNIAKFCDHFRLTINPAKSQVIVVSSKHSLNKIKYEELLEIKINNETIPYVDSVKYLGFYFDREFNHATHINALSKKVYFSLSQMSHLKYTLPTSTKLCLLKSLVLPLFDYMDIIYHEHGSHGSGINNTHIQKLFNAGIRFVYNLKYTDHTTPYIIESGLLPLHDRRETHITSMIYRIINNQAPPYLNKLIQINQNNTRSANKLIVQKPRNNFHKKSFFVSAPIIWNKLEEDVRTKSTINSFKSSIKNLYIQKYQPK